MRKQFLFAVATAAALFSLQQATAQSPYWSLLGNSNATSTSKLGTTNSVNLRLFTNDLERARFLSSNGYLGIGTTAPNSQLHVNAPSNNDGFRVQIAGSTKLFVGRAGGVAIGALATPPANGLYVAGNVGIGTTAPVTSLHVATGSDVTPSAGGFIVLGSTSGANIAIDNNEIMARNNGVGATLTLNNNGGNMVVNPNNTSGGSKVGINTPSPTSDLHILHGLGGPNDGLKLENSFGANLSWNIYSASTNELWLYNDGAFRGSFNGTSGAYTPVSDRKFKNNITTMEGVLEKVMKLRPTLYNFNTQTQSGARKYMGMIAQEVQPIFPEAVYEHQGGKDGLDDFLTMDYTAFGVIAIKAIQEQQQTIEKQQIQIDELKALVSKLTRGATFTTVTGAGSLGQSTPNPAKGSARISYSIPSNSRAQLLLTDNGGKTIKTISLTQAGYIDVNTANLSSGIYNYTLVVDGKPVETKKLSVVR